VVIGKEQRESVFVQTEITENNRPPYMEGQKVTVFFKGNTGKISTFPGEIKEINEDVGYGFILEILYSVEQKIGARKTSRKFKWNLKREGAQEGFAPAIRGTYWIGERSKKD